MVSSRILFAVFLLFGTCGALLTSNIKVSSWFEDFSINTLNNLRANDTSTAHFFNTAVLDHFGHTVATEETFWSQRYYADESYWCGEGCPVFLYIGGEGPQGPVSDALFMHALAEEHQALILALEHRFYGESLPVPDMSTENLKYLSSEQALADLARFRNYIALSETATSAGGDLKSDPPLRLKASASKSKFIVFGGSYPGNLAAWFKTVYPSLAVGSIASSAPVYAEFDFQQYAQVVGFALSYPLVGGSPECYDAVNSSVSQLHELLLETVPAGSSPDIPSALQPCSTMSSDLDLYAYESTVFGNFQGVVQYNLEGGPVTVSDMCDAMTSASRPIDGLAAVAALFTDQSLPFKDRCIGSSFAEDVVGPLTNTTFSGTDCGLKCSSYRQWLWQSCNEFGFFQTTSGGKQPFSAFVEGNVANAGRALCQQAFGIPSYVQPQTLWVNTAYGNRRVAGVNVTLVNGNVDPWHSLSVVPSSNSFYNSCTGGVCSPQSVGEDDQMVFIDGTGHCRDMYAPNALEARGVPDTPQVVEAHMKISVAVELYLQ